MDIIGMDNTEITLLYTKYLLTFLTYKSHMVFLISCTLGTKYFFIYIQPRYLKKN